MNSSLASQQLVGLEVVTRTARNANTTCPYVGSFSPPTRHRCPVARTTNSPMSWVPFAPHGSEVDAVDRAVDVSGRRDLTHRCNGLWVSVSRVRSRSRRLRRPRLGLASSFRIAQRASTRCAWSSVLTWSYRAML